MSDDIDFGMMELLTSKICHDLISPIGAINNGMELVEDMGPEAGDEAFALIGYSAAQASAKLQAFRMAFGAGGADSSIKPEDVHAAIEAIVGAEKKIQQNWDPYAPLGPEERPKGFAKMLISCLLLAIECLPKGGTLAVTGDENGNVMISAEGEDAGPRNDMEACLSLSYPREGLEPKHVSAYVTGLSAQKYQYKIALKSADSGIATFQIESPRT